MAIPNRLYFVVVEKYEDNKHRAHIEKVHRLSNLKCNFMEGRHPENILIIHLADNKKNAEQICDSWNENYKNNGVLHTYF